MSQSRLAHGVFLGTLARSVRVSGFQIDLRTATLPPDAVAEHAHDEAHFILTLDDGYRSLARDPGGAAAGPFGRGSLIYNPPGVLHRDCFDQAGGGFLAVSAPALPPGPLDAAPVRLASDRAGRIARRLVGTCLRYREGDALLAESQALDLASCAAAEDDRSGRAPDWLLAADEAIGDLCRTPGLRVSAIAALAGVHPVHLARRYRRHFGRSPGAAIRQRRADAAAALLAAGTCLAEAAGLSGYADQSHLTREFGLVFGVTPARYAAAFA